MSIIDKIIESDKTVYTEVETPWYTFNPEKRHPLVLSWRERNLIKAFESYAKDWSERTGFLPNSVDIHDMNKILQREVGTVSFDEIIFVMNLLQDMEILKEVYFERGTFLINPDW